MDTHEYIKILNERILKLEPEPIASKIIDIICLQEDYAPQIIRLALGPDSLIQYVIRKAKYAIQLALFPLISPFVNSDPSFHYVPSTPVHEIPPRLTSPWAFVNHEHLPYFNPNNIRVHQSPVKICRYFNKGICKHGSNCRYLHSQGQNFPVENEDHVFSPGSLANLEIEISELLKSSLEYPVSIASLPMLYYEKYGKTLQADGYLTESQRHGKSGFSLTKLLERLKNSIHLIDRPHGQHAVILAEDAPKYLRSRGERNNPGPIVYNSQQIYLTFPSESTFTEEDVSDYFSQIGPVQDVRIPCQQKRMFGFVTFVSSDTVEIILSGKAEHYIRGARVLVKPYREKLKARDHEKALEIQTRRLLNLKLAQRQRAISNQSFFGGIEDHAMFQVQPEYMFYDHTSNPRHENLGMNCADQEDNQEINLPDSPFASAEGSCNSTDSQPPQ